MERRVGDCLVNGGGSGGDDRFITGGRSLIVDRSGVEDRSIVGGRAVDSGSASPVVSRSLEAVCVSVDVAESSDGGCPVGGSTAGSGCGSAIHDGGGSDR